MGGTTESNKIKKSWLGFYNVGKFLSSDPDKHISFVFHTAFKNLRNLTRLSDFHQEQPLVVVKDWKLK